MGRESHCISRRSPGLVCRELGACIGPGCRDAGCSKADLTVTGAGSHRHPGLLMLPDTLLGSLLSASVLCSEEVMALHVSPTSYTHVHMHIPHEPLPHTSAVTLRTHTLPIHHTTVLVPQQPLAEEHSEGHARACAEGRMHSVLGSGT